jgi:hypothetical protein
MIVIAKISSAVGGALLLSSIFATVGALVTLPFKKLMAVSDGSTNILQESPSSNFIDATIGLSWLAWLIYAYLTIAAFLGEMFTLFTNAGFGYVYITLGMPAFLAAWLGLVIYASIRPIPTSWLFGAMGAAAIIIFGCANID